MLPWDPLWRLRHVGYPVSPRGYRGLPAFASLSMAGSEGSAPRHHFDTRRLRQLLQLSDRLRSRTRHLDAPPAPFSAATLLSLAYPERIARRRDAGSGRYRLASGKGATLPRDDSLGNAPLLAVAQMDAGSREGRIWLALELSQEELEEAHGQRMETRTELYWDPAAEEVRARRIRCLDALELSSRETSSPTGPEVGRLLLDAIRTRGIGALALPKGAEQLLARVQLAASFDTGGAWPDLSEAALMKDLLDSTRKCNSI